MPAEKRKPAGAMNPRGQDVGNCNTSCDERKRDSTTALVADGKGSPIVVVQTMGFGEGWWR